MFPEALEADIQGHDASWPPEARTQLAEGVFSPRPHVAGGAFWGPFVGVFIPVGPHPPDPSPPRGPAPNTVTLGLGLRSLH